jgi:general secretion pathway protein A
MYNDYFGLRENPFNVTPNPKYFYTNPVYQEAYATLLYGIRERKGFIVLSGEVGTGKTTLLRRLMDNREENVRLVFFYNTTLTFEDLVSFACDELGLAARGGRLQKIQALNEFLIAQSKNGGTVVLLVDEAQNLTDDVLENLRLLSNLETANEKLLQIVLVGQSELEVKLNQPQLRQIKQRVALHCRLDRLKEREVAPFINYRLRVAGYEQENLFTSEALREIAGYSRGIPRLINILCDNALLTAYAMAVKKISAEVIGEVAHDLLLDAEGQVASGNQLTARTGADGNHEANRSADVQLENLASRRPTYSTSVLVGSFAASILVLLIGGTVFFQLRLDAWLSEVVFHRFKPAKIESIMGMKPSRDSSRFESGDPALRSNGQVESPDAPDYGNGTDQLDRSAAPSSDPGSAAAVNGLSVRSGQSVMVTKSVPGENLFRSQ